MGQLFRFNGSVKTGARPSPQYRQLQRQLAQVGYVSQGSVFERGPGQQGSRYPNFLKARRKIQQNRGVLNFVGLRA
jgi:hypothetical protein